MILFEETFYTSEKQKYKVLCIESPICSKMVATNEAESNAEEIWNIVSLRVLESYDAYIKLFPKNMKVCM